MTQPSPTAAQTLALRVPNQGRRGELGPPFFQAYGEWTGTPPPTWEDIAWLRQEWGGPFMMKGIVRVDDARRAVDAGVSAISVSNHGGNNLDGTPAAIRCLPAIAEAVGDQIEVLLDSGIRRGSDVVKALALGARGDDCVTVGGRRRLTQCTFVMGWCAAACDEPTTISADSEIVVEATVLVGE